MSHVEPGKHTRSRLGANTRAHKDPFVAQQVVGHLRGFSIVTSEGAVDECGGEIGRLPADTNAVDEAPARRGKRTVLDETLEAGAGRVDQKDGERLVDRLEKTFRAGARRNDW